MSSFNACRQDKKVILILCLAYLHLIHSLSQFFHFDTVQSQSFNEVQLYFSIIKDLFGIEV